MHRGSCYMSRQLAHRSCSTKTTTKCALPTDSELNSKGVGMEDNVFRTPSEPYIDFSDPNTPLVVPVVQSGMYVPVSLLARYQVNSFENEGFFGSYRFGGRFYQDEVLNNADEYMQEIAFGSEYGNRTEEGETRVYSAFKIAQHEENYYDPDNGNERIVNGVDISDRMNYLRYGPEFSARQSGETLSFGVRAKGQLWNYEEAGDLPEYDHEYFLFSAYGQFKFTSTSLLRVTADYYSRRYGDRPAFDLDGQQRVGNPNIRYDYVALSMRARQRLGNNMWFGFDIKRTERTDQYVGYNDYTRDSFGFEFHWSPSGRFDLEASGTYNLYDFPNAFAFHEPTAGRKTQESVVGELLASYRVTRHISIVAEAELYERGSNDIRIQYDRTRYLIGVRWQQ